MTHPAAEPRFPPAPAPHGRPIGSTYRLQFHKDFTFGDAIAIIPYLRELGITHVYASPYLKARPGSTHGYDVIDHCSLNPEIGTREDYEAFVAELRSYDMGHILDIVPNHVGVATNDNVWWNDVLENGRHSRYGDYFDINWDGSPLPELHGKVLLPVLGEPYGTVLEKGQLQLKLDERGIAVWYYDRRFPISPGTYGIIVNEGPAELNALNRADSPELKRQFAQLWNSGSNPMKWLRERLVQLNGTAGRPGTFDVLDWLLNRQNYRLAWWRVAGQEINYRRFFDINDLAALRMELPEVFHATHDFVLGLVKDGHIDGLRVDHPDGLFDPQVYLQRLKDAGANYVVVEKILGADEPLPADWPCAGTTGYDFLAKINALFVDAANADAFSRIYQDWIGNRSSFSDWVYYNKKKVLAGPLASDLNMLALRIGRLAQGDRHSRDFTYEQLRTTLAELVARFGVYRTYVSARGHSPLDAQQLNQAEAAVRRRCPDCDNSILAFLTQILLQPSGDAELQIAGKFQQLTAPVTAKGIEDSTFYIFNRLTSLNEVGGDPGRFGESPQALHQYLADRQQHWPLSLSPLSTHDTKRSEDVRARISVLSEMPAEWEASLRRWDELNRPHRQRGGEAAIDANEQYLLYQTLLGSFTESEDRGVFVKRIQAYMLKAMREAKQRTTWTDPDEAHESAVQQFIADILDPSQSSEFLRDFEPLQQRIAHIGLLNSLSQTLLRLTAPGVPDTYQGSEWIDLSLVDPDNRRPVDYDIRQRMLNELRAADSSPSDLLEHMRDGRLKMYLTWRVLNLRRQHPELFAAGSYEPLRFTGRHRDRLFGFVRRHAQKTVITIVPRLVGGLIRQGQELPLGVANWQDTAVELRPELRGRFLELLGGDSILLEDGAKIGDILARLPVALLIRAPV